MQSSKINAIFIAGTDTGVGKTLITGLLASYLIGKGKRVVTQKWIATGNTDDIGIHAKIMGLASTEKGVLRVPYSFRFAASPHLAASLEGKLINEKKIKKAFLELSRRHDFVIVEGTGGLLVPVSRKKLLIDVVKAFRLPVILVVHNRLGAINHTLLSIEALQNRGILIIGAVFNNLSKTKKVILDDNQRIIEEISGITVLGELSRGCNIRMLKDSFKAIGDKIDLERLD